MFNDKWVPVDCKMNSPSSCSLPHPSLCVLDLIDFNNGVWNDVVLTQWFSAEIIHAIHVIPLLIGEARDSLFWWLTSTGVYSVQSGYRLGLLGHSPNDNIDESMRKFWVNIWKIPDPPKLGNFLWHACKRSLATKQVLYNRYYVPFPICDRCHSKPETIFHAFCECPNVAPMWNLSSSTVIHKDAPRSSVLSLFLWMMDHTSNENVLALCTNLWGAWFFRNKEVFTNEQCDPIQLASLHKMVREFNNYVVKVRVPH